MSLNQGEAVVAVGVACLAGVILVWMVYEAYALSSGRPPITWFVRKKIEAHQHWAIIISIILAFIMGALAGHFWWY